MIPITVTLVFMHDIMYWKWSGFSSSESAILAKFTTINLNQQLMDQLVSGVCSKSIVTKFMEPTEGLELTFNHAIERAVNVESTKKYSLDCAVTV